MTKCRICDASVPHRVNQCPKCGAPIDSPPPQAREDLERQVRSLLARGQKLEAIKLYAESTGVRLMEAKDAVEATELGPGTESPVETVSDIEAELLRLLRSGKKLDAIKLYRHRTGVQLLEAKQAVESLAARHGIVPSGRGCFGALATILVIAALVGMTVF